ncbi:acetylserotonin O-methyltransferase-like isoform X2 [Lissotriton helveticus]
MDIKSSSEDLQYPRLLLQYRDGFIASKAMFAACELGVFDLLQESGAPLPSATIAERLHASADGMERLLCACVGLKLLEIEMNNTEAFYKNTHLSALYLTKSSPKSLHSMMMHFSHTIYKYTEYLADAVREGATQDERAFGLSKETMYDAVYRSDDELLKFMHCMNSFWVLCGRDVITAFDLSSFSKVCDLGVAPAGLVGPPNRQERVAHLSQQRLKSIKLEYQWLVVLKEEEEVMNAQQPGSSAASPPRPPASWPSHCLRQCHRQPTAATPTTRATGHCWATSCSVWTPSRAGSPRWNRAWTSSVPTSTMFSSTLFFNCLFWWVGFVVCWGWVER